MLSPSAAHSSFVCNRKLVLIERMPKVIDWGTSGGVRERQSLLSEWANAGYPPGVPR